MNKKKKEVYTLGDYVIDANEMDKGWALVLNRKTNFKFSAMLGARLHTEKPEDLHAYFVAMEYMSYMALGDKDLRDSILVRAENMLVQLNTTTEDEQRLEEAKLQLEDELKKVLERPEEMKY